MIYTEAEARQSPKQKKGKKKKKKKRKKKWVHALGFEASQTKLTAWKRAVVGPTSLSPP